MAPVALAAIDNLTKPDATPGKKAAKKKSGLREWLQKEHK
jgi:hypothetical protein